jgi:hypothetical protein
MIMKTKGYNVAILSLSVGSFDDYKKLILNYAEGIGPKSPPRRCAVSRDPAVVMRASMF